MVPMGWLAIAMYLDYRSTQPRFALTVSDGPNQPRTALRLTAQLNRGAWEAAIAAALTPYRARMQTSQDGTIISIDYEHTNWDLWRESAGGTYGRSLPLRIRKEEPLGWLVERARGSASVSASSFDVAFRELTEQLADTALRFAAGAEPSQWNIRIWLAKTWRRAADMCRWVWWKIGWYNETDIIDPMIE
jgi:hypothetical protein